MTRLSDVVKIGDFVATSNIEGYEGVELGVYLGVITKAGEGLLLINWLNSSRGVEQVFTSDFNQMFYSVKLLGRNAHNKLIYRRIRKQFTHTDGPLTIKSFDRAGRIIVKDRKFKIIK